MKYNHITTFKLKSNQTLIMETIFPFITKREMFSSNHINYIRIKLGNFKIPFLTFHLTLYIYIYIYIIFIHQYF